MFKRLMELRVVTFVTVLFTAVLLVGGVLARFFSIKVTKGLTWVVSA